MTTNTITLETPITRGEQTITTVTLNKPNSGALRGVSLWAILQMNVDALTSVLPRISDPSLTAADITRMDVVDLLQLGSVVSSFLLPKASLQEDYVST